MNIHRQVREMVEGKKRGISNRKFFTSRVFAAHLADIARTQASRYGIVHGVRAQISWNTKNGFTAATDNQVISINAGNSLVTKQKGIENRYYMVLGMFCHELSALLLRRSHGFAVSAFLCGARACSLYRLSSFANLSAALVVSDLVSEEAQSGYIC